MTTTIMASPCVNMPKYAYVQGRALYIPDGSQFTTSAAKNSTLTIVSLALRQVEFIGQ